MYYLRRTIRVNCCSQRQPFSYSYKNLRRALNQTGSDSEFDFNAETDIGAAGDDAQT